MAKKNKITTDGRQNLDNNPFASIQLDNLKAAPAIPIHQKKKAVNANPNKSKGIVKIRREKTGRGGKTVIVIYEIPNHINMPAREKLLKEMKTKLGTGGTIKDRNVEIQGEKLDAVREFLISKEFSVKG